MGQLAKPDYWATLPDEVQLEILRKLSTRDLCAMSLTSKRIYELVKDKSIWASLPFVAPLTAADGSKDIHRQFHDYLRGDRVSTFVPFPMPEGISCVKLVQVGSQPHLIYTTHKEGQFDELGLRNLISGEEMTHRFSKKEEFATGINVISGRGGLLCGVMIRHIGVASFGGDFVLFDEQLKPVHSQKVSHWAQKRFPVVSPKDQLRVLCCRHDSSDRNVYRDRDVYRGELARISDDEWVEITEDGDAALSGVASYLIAQPPLGYILGTFWHPSEGTVVVTHRRDAPERLFFYAWGEGGRTCRKESRDGTTYYSWSTGGSEDGWKPVELEVDIGEPFGPRSEPLTVITIGKQPYVVRDGDVKILIPLVRNAPRWELERAQLPLNAEELAREPWREQLAQEQWQAFPYRDSWLIMQLYSNPLRRDTFYLSVWKLSPQRKSAPLIHRAKVKSDTDSTTVLGFLEKPNSFSIIFWHQDAEEIKLTELDLLKSSPVQSPSKTPQYARIIRWLLPATISVALALNLHQKGTLVARFMRGLSGVGLPMMVIPVCDANFARRGGHGRISSAVAGLLSGALYVLFAQRPISRANWATMIAMCHAFGAVLVTRFSNHVTQRAEQRYSVLTPRS